jgi:osmotically inducible protein OsmC
MSISKASARWDGVFRTGTGVMNPEHGGEVRFSAGSRFQGEKGSNPEEMIGAALAGCFSMALSVALEKAGSPPKSIRTAAEVKLEKEGDGFTITGIALRTEADVPGIEDAKFQEIAAATKKGCPVSKALASVPSITLEATLSAE